MPKRDRLRTFIAVEVPAELRARARQLIRLFDGTGASVKWVDDAQLHFTLNFLGDVEVLEASQVCQVVRAATAELAPFAIEVRGAGAFPHVARPRTVWLGVGEGESAMVALHDALELELEALGFRPEGRRFRPHLTVGRVRGTGEGIGELAARIAAQQDFSAGRMVVDEVTVFTSRLERQGPVHDVLATAELRG